MLLNRAVYRNFAKGGGGWGGIWDMEKSGGGAEADNSFV